jgi:F-type H+-transporting ATPase subunit a
MAAAADATTNALEQAARQPDRSAAIQEFIEYHLGDATGLHVPGVAGVLPGGLSLHGLMLLLAAALLTSALVLLARRRRDVPSGFGNLAEAFVEFIRDHIAIAYLGEDDGRRMTPYFCSLFAFILVANLFGLIPCLYTATANLSVTGALAALSLGFMIVGAMFKHGPVGFFAGLAPKGVPWPVLIILVPIEFVGLFVRAFALTIRLFANMLAGHIVLFFIVGLVFIFGYAALPVLAMAVGIYLLEVLIAFLQAYIFTLLSAVFIGQTYHPAH